MHNASVDVNTLAGAVDACSDTTRQLIAPPKFSPCSVTTVCPDVGPLLGMIDLRIIAGYAIYSIAFDI
jgi:hypothetical protein